MEKHRTVSVIIPAFNRADLIGEAIDSVLGQDIENCAIEIIVVDDGSTDNTREVVEAYGDRVTYLYQRNAGAGVARNHGIQAASGEWIAFLDSDDRWLPYKLAVQFRVLEAFPQYRIVHSDFHSVMENGYVQSEGLKYWASLDEDPKDIDWSEIYKYRYKSSDCGIDQSGQQFDIYAGNIFQALLQSVIAYSCTFLLHRDCLTARIQFSEIHKTWEDYWFLCMVAESYEVIFIDLATYEQRAHRGYRLSQVPYIEKLKCHIDACNLIYLPSEKPERPDNLIIRYQLKKLYIASFKEHLRSGLKKQAKDILKNIDELDIVFKDRKFEIYKIILYLPFNMLYYLMIVKRFLHGFNPIKQLSIFSFRKGSSSIRRAKSD